MAEIVRLPRHAPRPALRLVCNIDDLVAAETAAKAHADVANATEHMAPANLELNNVNVILLQRSGDVDELASEETITSLCHTLIAVIDAKGNRNADRPLHGAAMQAIAEREGACHDR